MDYKEIELTSPLQQNEKTWNIIKLPNKLRAKYWFGVDRRAMSQEDSMQETIKLLSNMTNIPFEILQDITIEDLNNVCEKGFSSFLETSESR